MNESSPNRRSRFAAKASRAYRRLQEIDKRVAGLTILAIAFLGLGLARYHGTNHPSVTEQLVISEVPALPAPDFSQLEVLVNGEPVEVRNAYNMFGDVHWGLVDDDVTQTENQFASILFPPDHPDHEVTVALNYMNHQFVPPDCNYSLVKAVTINSKNGQQDTDYAQDFCLPPGTSVAVFDLNQQNIPPHVIGLR